MVSVLHAKKLKTSFPVRLLQHVCSIQKQGEFERKCLAMECNLMQTFLDKNNACFVQLMTGWDKQALGNWIKLL